MSDNGELFLSGQMVYTDIANMHVMDMYDNEIVVNGTIGISLNKHCESISSPLILINDQLNAYVVDCENCTYRFTTSGDEDKLRYAGRTALLRTVHQELYNRGVLFPGYIMTCLWDLAEPEYAVMIDNIKYDRRECVEEAVGHTVQPLQNVRCVDGKWYLDKDLSVCPKCGTHYVTGGWCSVCNVKDWRGDVRVRSECERIKVFEDGSIRYAWRKTDDPMAGYKRCDNCGVWCPEDELFRGLCDNCLGEEYGYGDDSDFLKHGALIDHYHSHRKDRWFGHRDKDGVFKGLGFELEVDGNPRSREYRSLFNNIAVEEMLERSGISTDELVFETDSSLCSGFEIISMPHTVDEFWRKKDKWAKMLDALHDLGFKSHDGGTCGLHLHISREMFGKTQKEQDLALAKVHKMYHVFWDDMLKASRRRSLRYCDRNENRDRRGSTLDKDSNIVRWKYAARIGDHYRAINDRHSETVEFRLGRGTLNPKAFFAWIDLTLTIVKNSKKSSNKLNDAKEWLKGISPYTAEYLLSRGAFVEPIRSLMPEAAWGQSTSDTQEV